jgi:uncharacterized protein YndB with AHSA1/START domain
MTTQANPATLTVQARAVSCRVFIRAPSADVFAVWADVAQWHTWDPDTQWARIDGPFATGARGKIKSKQPLAVGLIWTNVQPDRAFTVEARTLATTMRFEHTLEPAPGGVQVTHTTHFQGLLAALFMRTIGTQLQHGLPVTMQRLKARCETPPDQRSACA